MGGVMEESREMGAPIEMGTEEVVINLNVTYEIK